MIPGASAVAKIVVDTLLPSLTKVIEHTVPDPTAQAEALKELEEIRNAPLMKQMDINIAEASHPSLFVSGWRPAAGWVGVIALGYMSLGHNVIVNVLTLFGVDTSSMVEPNTEIAMFILMNLLGIGSLRTYEKIKGVNSR